MAVAFRDARAEDLPAIVAMLADDPLGAAREDASLPLAESYLAAFERVAADPNIRLVTAEEDGRVVGTLQLVLIPGISRKGAWRGLIQAVRIAADRRGQGIGAELIGWAIETCRAKGCVSVQLATDLTRVDAHRFYDRLGFIRSHAGFTMKL